METVAQVAYILRHGHSHMTFDQVTIDVDQPTYATFQAGTQGPLRMVLPLRLNLFGEEVLLGYLVGEITEVRVAAAADVPGSVPPLMTVRLEPATDEARNPVFRFQRNEPAGLILRPPEGASTGPKTGKMGTNSRAG